MVLFALHDFEQTVSKLKLQSVEHGQVHVLDIEPYTKEETEAFLWYSWSVAGNEAAMPMGGLDIFIQTSDNKKVESSEGISSLGPGLTRKFTFEFPLQSGNWTFMLRSPTVEADLGPYDDDFTYQAERGRVYNNAIGSGMFTDAFTSDLDDFGNVEERGLIDASSIKMTSYFGENSAGGSTAITASSVPKEAESSEDAPRVPPWERANDPLLSTSVPSTSEPAKTTEVEAPASDLLAFSKQVSGSSDVSTEGSRVLSSESVRHSFQEA